jgi:hypothetical protein
MQSHGRLDGSREHEDFEKAHSLILPATPVGKEPCTKSTAQGGTTTSITVGTSTKARHNRASKEAQQHDEGTGGNQGHSDGDGVGVSGILVVIPGQDHDDGISGSTKKKIAVGTSQGQGQGGSAKAHITVVGRNAQ